jgi:arylsulfatase A-like enzyme
VLLAVGAAGVLACGDRLESPSSVVLIVIDTLRADHMGAYGHSRPTSPHFDRWAQRGALYERAFASSPWTLPSFGAIYTGRYPSHHRAGQILERELFKRKFAKLDASVPTLAQILVEHGYATAAVVTNPFLHPTFGIARGIESYDYVRGGNAKARRADEVVDRALDWLDQREERPFLLVAHIIDPHLSYDPPESVRGRFSGNYSGQLELPMDLFLQIRAGLVPLDEADRRFIEAAYDEELLFVDEQVGRLLDEIETRGLLRATLVALTSDHGEEIFDHDGFEHGHSEYQELLHVPLVFWGPGIRAGRIRAPVSHVDLLPTLLEALDLPVPSGLPGVSLWPNLIAAQPLPDRALLAEGTLYGPERKALVRWPWKLIEASEGEDPMLFDLANDPAETRDLASAHPQRLGELLRELRDLSATAPEDGTQEPASIDAETRQQLESLGYLQ